MTDFNPGDPPVPEEEPTDEEYEEMAESQADEIDAAGRYVAEFELTAENRERAENLRSFDEEGVSIEQREDTEYLVFRKADPSEFFHGAEIIGERLAGV